MGSKKDTDSVYVSWRMKRSRHGIAVNQDNYIKEVDNADAGAYNYRDRMKVVKENEQSHFRKLEDIERAGRVLRNPKKRGIELQFRNLGDSKEAILVVCTDAMGKGETIRLQWEKMSGMDEGTTRLALVNDSKSSQEACHTDNQPKDKRTAFDIAVLRRSANMSIYSIMWRPRRSLLADPPTKQGACRKRLKQALMSGRVDMAF